jgi:hypothetical protein
VACSNRGLLNLADWDETSIGEATVKAMQRDLRKTPDEEFQYVDVSSVSRESFKITDPTPTIGSEAPSRARKEILTDEVLFATVRSTLQVIMYETDGSFSGAIILLDEPGLHLHAAAQRDLLERMKSYAKGNQLVYTTHLPFMIDFKRLDNICVAEEIPKEGTKIHTNWATADKDARFTLQAALGLSWSQSLFVGNYNLVVEGVDDFWFLQTSAYGYSWEPGFFGISAQSGQVFRSQ